MAGGLRAVEAALNVPLLAERGAVIGLFNFAGALGILLIGGAAGWAFDRLGPASPFLIVGGLNAAVALAALAMARRAAPA